MKQSHVIIVILLTLCACSPGIDTYVRQLQYPNTDMRVYAAEKLGQSKNPNAVPHLIQALNDEKLSVRLAAIDALGYLQDHRATQSLLPFLRNERLRFVFATIEALGRIGDPDAVDSLNAIVADNLPTIRLAAIDALGQIGSPKATDVLTEQFKNPSSDVRRMTALAMARIADRKTMGVLIESLADPSDAVSKMACYALDKMDAQWRNGEEAKTALSQFKYDLMMKDIVDNDAILKRYGLLKGLNTIDPNWHHRAWGEAVTRHYEGYLNSPIPRERWMAARVLGDIGDVRAIDALLACLNHEDRGVSKNAILSLGKLGDRRVLPSLREILSGDDLQLKSATATALADLGDTTAIPLLMDQITPEIMQLRIGRIGRDIAYSIANALGKLKATQSVDLLMQLVTHSQSGTRVQALRALGNIGDFKATSSVRLALVDRDFHVRTTAVKTLAKLGDVHAVNDLITLLGSGKVSDPLLVESLDRLEPRWRERKLAQSQISQLIAQYKSGNTQDQKDIIAVLAEVGGARADEILSEVLKKRNLLLIAQAHKYYITQGISQALPVLKHALEAYGNERMVKVYLASGYEPLSQAARIWAHDHGMALVSGLDMEPEVGIWAGG